MRRPLRWLVNGLGKALCLLSLPACVGTAWLWWRSRAHFDEWWGTLHGRLIVLRSHHDGLEVELGKYPPPGWHQPMACSYSGMTRATVVEDSSDFAPVAMDTVTVSAPHPAVASTCALPPLLWLGLALRARRLYVRRRRRRLGLCLRCGYDLRATPAGGGPPFGRCPECGAEGTVPEAGRARAAGQSGQ